MRQAVPTTTGIPWPPVRHYLRTAQRARAGRTATAIAATLYELLLTTAIVGGVAYGLAGDLLDQLTDPPPTASGLLAVATGVATIAGMMLAARAVGPLVADPARAGWLLPSPVERTGLLAASLRTVLALAAAAGVLGAVAVAAAAGWALDPVLLVAGGLAGLAVGELAVVVQVRPAAAARVSSAARAFIVAALLTAAGVAAIPGAASRGEPAPPGSDAVIAVAVVLCALCLLLAVPAIRAPSRAGARELVAGAPIMAALWSAHLEHGLVADVVRERRLSRRGPVRSARLPGGRTRATVAAAFIAVRRNRAALGRVAACAVVPHVAALLLPPVLIPAVQLGAVTVAAFAAASTLTVIARSPALRRALGGTDRGLLRLHSAPPAMIAVLVAVLVAPAGGTIFSAVLVPIAALAVVLRELTRPEPVLSATLLDTPLGTLPVEQIRDRLLGGAGAFLLAAIVATAVG